MHLLDGFTLVIDKLEKDDKCDYKPPKREWKVNLNGNSSTLARKLGNKPDAAKASQLSATSWPSQAHHLIPHKTLKEHEVADFLKKGDFLYENNHYDVDHKNNGMWLPYASSLEEWKTGSRCKSNRDLMFKVMEVSNMQLHQSRHSAKRYGSSVAGYHERVAQYLKKIESVSVSHFAGIRPCEDCKSKAQAGKYPARENVVRYVDLASARLKKDILACRIFVSKIAADFADTIGFK